MSLLPGVQISIEERADAIATAQKASIHRSTNTDIRYAAFADASLAGDRIRGGIAVVRNPWLPQQNRNNRSRNSRAPSIDLVEAAWSVNPTFDSILGEVISLSQALHEVIDYVCWNAQSPILAGRTVHATLFNDNVSFIDYIRGNITINVRLGHLIAPFVHLIRRQVDAFLHLGVRMPLKIRWIPGHRHSVTPHMRADRLARQAMERGRSWCSRSQNSWSGTEEPPVVRFLWRQMGQAVLDASLQCSFLRSQITATHPAPAPSPGPAPASADGQDQNDILAAAEKLMQKATQMLQDFEQRMGEVDQREQKVEHRMEQVENRMEEVEEREQEVKKRAELDARKMNDQLDDLAANQQLWREWTERMELETKREGNAVVDVDQDLWKRKG